MAAIGKHGQARSAKSNVHAFRDPVARAPHDNGKDKTMRRLTMYRVIIVAGLLAAAGCNAGAGSSSARSSAASGKASNSVLTISNASGALWTCDFNPFNPNDNAQSVGFNYEP